MKLSLLLLPALALVGVGSLALASPDVDPLALAYDASPQLDKRMKADSVRVEADVRAQVKDAGHRDSMHHGDGQDVSVDVEVEVEVEVDRHGDDIIDGCPRRYHRNRASPPPPPSARSWSLLTSYRLCAHDRSPPVRPQRRRGRMHAWLSSQPCVA